MIAVDCIRGEHVSGTDRFPIFIGFMKASDLGECAEAPQFSLLTEHEVIAGNISSVPVREWQRPIDMERVAEIERIFTKSAEIMPNAVLLAAPDPSLVHLTGQGGDSWKLELMTEGRKPLWILDGQHRIAGLTASRPDDAIPFVLLASHGSSAQYQESTFARIFAQVTTTAEGLHPLHDEWLTFAFRLGKYDAMSPSSGAKNAQEVEAMEFVVALCHERHLDAQMESANPFFNRVAFNPQSVKRREKSPAVGPVAGGFQIDAAEFQRIASKSYYSSNLPAGKLSGAELAREVGNAYEALVACHPAAHRADSVLLNPAGAAGSKGHKALQEGILHGFLRHLAENGRPEDWSVELRKRSIETTDWRAKSWSSATRSGTQGTTNRKLARAVFESLLAGSAGDLFLPGAMLPPKLDLRNYFSGDVGWGMFVQGRRTGVSGRKAKFAGGVDPSVRLESGTVLSSIDIGALRMMAVGKTTPNLVAVSVADVGRPFEKEWTYAGLRAGLNLDPAVHLHSNPARIRFDFTFYGGMSRYVELEIAWS